MIREPSPWGHLFRDRSVRYDLLLCTVYRYQYRSFPEAVLHTRRYYTWPFQALSWCHIPSHLVSSLYKHVSPTYQPLDNFHTSYWSDYRHFLWSMRTATDCWRKRDLLLCLYCVTYVAVCIYLGNNLAKCRNLTKYVGMLKQQKKAKKQLEEMSMSWELNGLR